MKQAVQPFRRFQFGVFEADLRTGELTKLGKRVRLQEQPFQCWPCCWKNLENW